VIELQQRKAAGRLGKKGVRSWIEFTTGSPKDPRGARFFIFGPWGDGRYGALGHHIPGGWVLRWQVDGHFYEVTVLTFADIMRLAKLGPEKAKSRVLVAIHDAGLHDGIAFSKLGAG